MGGFGWRRPTVRSCGFTHSTRRLIVSGPASLVPLWLVSPAKVARTALRWFPASSPAGTATPESVAQPSLLVTGQAGCDAPPQTTVPLRRKTTRAPTLRAASSTLIVPMMLTSAS